MQHGEYGGCPDAGTEQDDWSIAGAQNKTAPRRAYIQNIARVFVIAKIRADNPVRLSFNAYPISAGAGHARHRVIPEQRWAVGGCAQPYNQKLSG